jgi:hypothetical protein
MGPSTVKFIEELPFQVNQFSGSRSYDGKSPADPRTWPTYKREEAEQVEKQLTQAAHIDKIVMATGLPRLTVMSIVSKA